MKIAQPPSSVTIRQIEFEEKAKHGFGMPYDAERVGQLRNMLREARKGKLSEGLAERRKSPQRRFIRNIQGGNYDYVHPSARNVCQIRSMAFPARWS
jgi:hypothetical protein